MSALKIRTRFGVVQDAAVHKYVTLVGTTLTDQSTRAKLPWTFIVLDTDGVNAFAAPGGFVHITRGALALIKSEAELAGVLGHEIAHVAQKHTVNAIRKARAYRSAPARRSSNRGAFLGALANRAYDMVLENSFDRGDELDADKEGILLVQKAGYAGTGLSEFLARLAERNKAQAEKNGLFASHPETQERIAKVKQLAASKPGAVVAARYTSTIKYPPTDLTNDCDRCRGIRGAGRRQAAAAAKPEEKKAEEKKKGFGLGNLTKSTTAGKNEQQVSASGGARGVGADRMAKGRRQPEPCQSRDLARRDGRLQEGDRLAPRAGQRDRRPRASGDVARLAPGDDQPAHPRPAVPLCRAVRRLHACRRAASIGFQFPTTPGRRSRPSTGC